MADIKDFKHAIVRQKILDAVRKDLIGPVSDCEQLNEVPTSSYITGLLYPADTDVTEDENYNDVEFKRISMLMEKLWRQEFLKKRNQRIE